jgi:LPXTG-site transpeptidase (sortase) family protein
VRARPSDVRRGLLALVLALLALVVAPAAPAGAPAPVAGPTEVRSGIAPRGHVTGVPVLLRIPSIGVAADVEAVAAEGGVLAPPADPALVGWWAAGARAGSRGGAVLLTGHTVHGGGGVFDDLAALDRGDVVEVGTRAGVVTYVVATVRELDKEQLASTAPSLFGAGGPPRVVLVTCADWDDGDYLGNTVVVGVRPAGS